MKKLNIKILSLILLVAFATTAFAQGEEAKKKDNSGTNPANFTYDYRIYYEMQQFKDDGGSQFRTIMEFRAPFGRDLANVTATEAGALWDLGSRFQVRFRGYYNSVSLNDAATNTSTTYSGIGDFDARFLSIAYSTSKFVVAPGLEAFFNTASNDVIGSGSTVLAPVVFLGWFGLIGKHSIFAPGYQHRFSVDGNKVNQSVLDLYFVWMLAKGKNWVIVNPQPIYDWENDAAFAVVDVEWGFMIAKAAGLAGSIRPGFGVGADRPFNYNLEFGVDLFGDKKNNLLKS
jgi:hypothetical protein